MRNSRRIALTALALAVVLVRFLGEDAGERGGAGADVETRPVGVETRAQRGAPGIATDRVVARAAERAHRRATGTRSAAAGPGPTAAERGEPDAIPEPATALLSGAPLVLDAPAPDASAVRFAGFDPRGPRRVLLWRLRDGRRAVIARATSRPGGAFEFSPLRVPAAGLEVVATPEGATPEGPEASRWQRLPPRTPEAPRGLSLGASRIRVLPAEAAGAVLLATEAEGVIGRFPLAGLPGPAHRGFDLEVLLAGEGARVLLAHELPSGLRSPWRPLAIETSATASRHQEE